MTRAVLVPHSTSGPGGQQTVSAEWRRDGASLWLRFVVEGDPDRIAWPASGAAERADDLWKHTCFEAFVSEDDGYVEYNLSPSGRWASYRFSAYRDGMRTADEAVVVDGLDGAADLAALEGRVELPPGARRLALSAVIEGIDGGKTYWALAHPSDKPDFHHPDSFTLELPALEQP